MELVCTLTVGVVIRIYVHVTIHRTEHPKKGRGVNFTVRVAFGKLIVPSPGFFIGNEKDGVPTSGLLGVQEINRHFLFFLVCCLIVSGLYI